ncbi:uncharacterized protein [Paramormyrops kingsleyae]|uniref:uncharacterized protein isoform X2 n=1 Tax=Paramormyrops kingsleyae TaxID=1676925 RepID=UPI003B97C52F
MINQTSRPNYQINYMYVICGSLCCTCLAVGLYILYTIGGLYLTLLCLSIACCVVIIMFWYLVKTGRIPIERIPNSNYNILHDSIPVHMLVSGETFRTHKTFMQKLNLQIELCSAESSSVILVFCPVVSRIGTDMEAAMARVTEDKPVILVFMHHCHHPSHMTNITVQPSRSNIVQVVHCAFHESRGLLECKENEEAVDKVLSALLRNLHAEVPQSKVLLTTSDMEKQPMGAQDANRPNITSDSEPVGEESESDQCKDQPKKDSCGSSADLIILSEGQAPEVQESNVDDTNVDMEEKPMAAQDGKRSHNTNDSERPGKGTDPAELPAEVPQPDVCIDKDRKQQPISTQDTDSLNISNDNAIPGKGTDPAGEESESDQKTIVSPMEHSTGSSGELPAEVPQPDVCIDMDRKQQPISTQDTDSLNITNDNAIPGKGTDPAGEESESDQKTIVSPMEHSTGSSGELPAEVPQPDVCIDKDRKQQPISTQDTDSLNITNDNAIPGKGTDPAGEESESDQKTIVSPMEHSTGSSGELPAEVPQPDVCMDKDRKQQSISTQDTDSLNITNDNAIPGKGTDPAGEESESDQKTIVSPMEHSTGSSGGKGYLEA